MKLSYLAFALAWAELSSAAAPLLSNGVLNNSGNFKKVETLDTNRFLVQFKDGAAFGDSPEGASAFLKLLETRGVKAQIAYRYSPIIFNGISVYLSTPSDSSLIGKIEDVSSVNQIKVTKLTGDDVTLGNSTISLLSEAKTTYGQVSPPKNAPKIAIQKSQYQFTAGASSLTFTHAKKNAIAAGLIESDTPVYAYFFSYYFPSRGAYVPNTEAWVPVYETKGNSGDFKLDKLPDGPTGQVTVYLTTANGKDTTIAEDNIISTLGLLTILPAGQRDPYPTSSKWNLHHLTGVDKLHAKGIRGKGIKVGYIDGGIAYDHPALGGGFGPGFKVEGGYDIVGEFYPIGGDGPQRVASQWEGDEDPMDLCSYSTCWAGVLAADDEYTGMTGVAPDATLYAYKTTNCFSDGGDDTLLDALQRAYYDDVDIIHLGRESRFPGGAHSPIALATARLVEEGIFVTTATGNTGSAGSFLSASSAMGKGVAAVGSVDLDEVHATVVYATIDGKRGTQRQIPYMEEDGTGASDKYGFPLVTKMPVIAVNGSCTLSIPPSTPANLENYTVIVPRECPFDEIRNELNSYKAKNIMVYNTDPAQTIPIPFWSQSLPGLKNFASISYEDGKFLVDTLATGAKITLEYNFFPGVGVPNKNNGGFLSDWTGWGPTYDSGLWPQVVAPGGNIFTTWQTNHYSYTNVGGTLAAQAYLTGVAALYYSQHGGKKGLGRAGAAALLDNIISTATPIVWQDGTGEGLTSPFKKRDGTGLAPVAQQGGGFINPAALLSSTSTVTPTFIRLGDKSEFQKSWSIKVSNPSGANIEYSVQHNPSVTFIALDATAPFLYRAHPGAVTNDNKAVLDFSATKFILRPGASGTVEVTITAPPDLESGSGQSSELIPVYSGYIQISGSNGEVLNVPYQGIASDLHAEVPIWSPLISDYPAIGNYDLSKIISPPYGDPENPLTFYMGANDMPIFFTYNTYGSDELRIDVVDPAWEESDWSYPPEKNFIGSIQSYGDGYNPGVVFPASGIGRAANGFTDNWGWGGVMADGTTIPNGLYKVVISVLLPHGDRTKREDWQLRASVPFKVEIGF